MKIKNAKKVLEKAKQCKVEEVWPGMFEVKSPSGETYTVQLSTGVYFGGTCTCKWGQFRDPHDMHRSGCAHVQAAVLYKVREKTTRSVSAWPTMEDTYRQHRPWLYLGDGVFYTLRKDGT